MSRHLVRVSAKALRRRLSHLFERAPATSASLIGCLGSSTFRLSTTSVSMSLTGSRFSSESALGPFHHGVRGRGGTIYYSALPSIQRQVQAEVRSHLIRRPARDIIPLHGGARVSFYWIGSFPVFMLLPRRLVLWSSGTRCREPIYGGGSRPTGVPELRSPFLSRGAWRSASPRP